MDEKFQIIKKEIEKINQRIKEYLWKKWNPVKTSNFKKEIEKINQRIKEYLWKKWYLFKVKKN